MRKSRVSKYAMIICTLLVIVGLSVSVIENVHAPVDADVIIPEIDDSLPDDIADDKTPPVDLPDTVSSSSDEQDIIEQQRILVSESILKQTPLDKMLLLQQAGEDVRARVTCVYEGDYTLEYALSNDLSDFDKEAWVNAGEYRSKSEYLVWISLAYQRVNIFEWFEINDTDDDTRSDDDNDDDDGNVAKSVTAESVGYWQLIRTCIVGTGAPRTPTPTGTFYINGQQEQWNMTAFFVRPIVNFSAGDNYAFHSRPYFPGFEELYDPGIGYPISHGCIRMYDEDIQFLFDEIPVYSTVVVY